MFSILLGSVSTIAFKTFADKVCFSSVEVLLTSSTTLLTKSSFTTATTFAINWLSSEVFSAFWTASVVNSSICSLLFSESSFNLPESFSEIPEITSKDRFVSVSISFISSITLLAVSVFVLTMISDTMSVKFSSSSIPVPSFWFLADSTVCLIITSFTSWLITSILSGSVSTIFWSTFADKVCFSSIETLLTSSIITFTKSLFTTDTTWAINSLSSEVFSAFWTASFVSSSICSLLLSESSFSFPESFSEIPEITSKDRFVSVSISFISSITFAAVSVSVFTIISVTASVRSSSSIRLPSFWSFVASIACSIKSSLISSLILSIFSGSVSTIAFRTLIDSDFFSSTAVLLTSSTTLFASSSFAIATTFAIRWLSSVVFSAFLIAEIVNFSTWSLFVSANSVNFSALFSDIPEITFKDKLVSVSTLETSSISLDAVSLSVLTIISATTSVKSSSIAILVSVSCWVFTASTVCLITISLISSLIISILLGWDSTIALRTFADKSCFSDVLFLLTSSTTLFAISSLATATTFAINSVSSLVLCADWTAFSANLSILSLLISAKSFILFESLSDIPDMTFKDKLVSVSIFETSSINFDAVLLSVLTIIAATASVKSSSKAMFVSVSCWVFTASTVCLITTSFISSLIISILLGWVSTIALRTFADKSCFSAVLFLLTSSTTLFANSSLATDTTLAIKFASSFDVDAFSTAETANLSIWSLFVSDNIWSFSGDFSEKSAITFNDNLDSSFVFFSVILFITELIVASSDFAMTLLKTSADLSVSFATIVSNIFSLIRPAPSEVEVVMNSLSLSDKFPTTPSTNVSFVSIIFSIVSPIFWSSDWSITSDKKVVFSSLLFSTIKSIFCFFSSLIISFAASTSLSSTTPSLFASWRFPLASFSSSCCVNSFSSILETFTRVSFTDLNSCFSSSDCSRWAISLVSVTSITWSVEVKLVDWPSDEISIWPTLPKLSSARATSEFPFGFTLALNLVPLIPRDIFDKSINISPLAFLAIAPVSIIILPFPTFAWNFCFAPDFSNSLTLSEVNSFITIVVLSSNWIVAEELSPIKISSFK